MMKPFLSIFRRDRPSRRPARTFASTLGVLERRDLLAIIGPVATIAQTVSVSVAATAITSSFESDHQGWPHPPDSSDHHEFGADHGGRPFDPVKDHVALDVAGVLVAGVATPEFALANASQSKVMIRVGLGGPSLTLGAEQGIDHPLSIKLADINRDSFPDLIVANTGADNVLVFAGLSGGLVGTGAGQVQTFAVGSQPVSVTIGDLNSPGIATDMIVTNRGFDDGGGQGSVTVLLGQGQGASWTATAGQTIRDPSRPVKTALFDVNDDGHAELFVCDSRSNQVAMYAGQADGQFASVASMTFAVGSNPTEVFIGRFDRRSRLDLVTVNSGSNDLTFIGGAFGPHPVTSQISSGGVLPEAAFAIPRDHDGLMDLVVANSGDGHLALLRGADDGLELAGVISTSSLPLPTGLAPSSWSNGGYDFFAASAGEDAAQLFHFDLGALSTFLPGLDDGSTALSEPDTELYSELMPFGDSLLELIAVFWAGSPESQAIGDERESREPSTITALYDPDVEEAGKLTTTAGDLLEQPPGPDGPPSDSPSTTDPAGWARFVLGIDQALERPRGPLEAVALQDAIEPETIPVVEGLARLTTDGPGLSPDLDPDGTSRAVDEALHLFRSGAIAPEVESSPTLRDPSELDGMDLPVLEGRLESGPEGVALISSALVASTRLILRASPPRPPVFRRKPGPRLGLGRTAKSPLAGDGR